MLKVKTARISTIFIISLCMDFLFLCLQAIDRYAKRLYGNSLDMNGKEAFGFVEETLCFEPKSFKSPGNSWTVETTQNNVVSLGHIFCVHSTFSVIRLRLLACIK